MHIETRSTHPPDDSLLQMSGKPLDQTYCGHCHLATPTWRNRCIHCKQVLENPREEFRREVGAVVMANRKSA